MSLGERGPHERWGGEKGAPLLKRRYFTAIGSSNVKIVVDVLLIITSTCNEFLRNVNIDDLE